MTYSMVTAVTALLLTREVLNS